jgi:adenosine deaminase
MTQSAITPPVLADLHRHHDTSHTPESILRVSKKYHIEPFETMSVEQIRREIQVPEGLKREQWQECIRRIRRAYVSPDAVAELTGDVMDDAAREGLGLLELRVSLLSTVDAICDHGRSEASAPFWEVARKTLEAILKERQKRTRTCAMSIDLILSISCQKKYLPLVDDYVSFMKDFASEIIAVDLANERDNEPTKYLKALERIHPYIPFLTAHCMETEGPERGWDLLKLNPDRIGHGIRAAEDPRLVEEIASRKIPLEICPLSNLMLGVWKSGEYPFRKFDDAGLILTIGHDGLNDSRTLRDDYEIIRKAFGYEEEDVARFRQNAWNHAFRNLKKFA